MTAAEVWEAVMADARNRVPEPTMAMWFDPVRPIAIEGERLIVEAPEMVRNWLARRYAPWMIKPLIAEIAGLTELELRIIDTEDVVA